MFPRRKRIIIKPFLHARRVLTRKSAYLITTFFKHPGNEYLIAEIASNLRAYNLCLSEHSSTWLEKPRAAHHNIKKLGLAL